MTTTIANASGLTAAHDLRAVMQGQVVVAGEDAYGDVRRIWNGAVNHQPALFALCETVEDVQNAVRTARAHNLPLSVHGGGHDWAGRALRDGGFVLDLSRMRHVEVDEAAKEATIAGGATGTDLGAASAPFGLAAVTPNVGAVGMAGFLLAGGYGGLTTRFGLAVDSLLEAQLVLADGDVVWTNATHNDDLFWAIRGGGGNFGVVTSMRIRLHPVREFLTGLILFPWSDAHTVLRGYAKMMSSAPDELSMQAGQLPMPDGSKVLFVTPLWTGEAAQGEKYIDRINSLGTPLSTEVAPMSFSELLNLYSSYVVNGRNYVLRTLWLDDITPGVISAVVAAGSARTSPHSFAVFHHLHGPGTRVASDATAFHLRRNHFMIEIGAAWEEGTDADAIRHRRWASDLFSSLAPFSLPGGYANFLTPDDHDQIDAAYGANARRLRELKRKFDPDNVFSSAIPLPD
jgi:hypothetical protein